MLGGLYGAYTLRVRATVACDVGVNAGAATLGLVLLLPFCAAAVVVAAEIVRRRLAPLLALTLVCGLSALVVMWILAATGPPPDYPNAVATCIDNVPQWWPAWLPT